MEEHEFPRTRRRRIQGCTEGLLNSLDPFSEEHRRVLRRTCLLQARLEAELEVEPRAEPRVESRGSLNLRDFEGFFDVWIRDIPGDSDFNEFIFVCRRERNRDLDKLRKDFEKKRRLVHRARF